MNSVLCEMVDPNFKLRLKSGLLTKKVIQKAHNHSQLMIKMKKDQQKIVEQNYMFPPSN